MTIRRLHLMMVFGALIGANVALADTPGKDWMPKEKAIQSLAHQGYANAYLKADDGHWEGEATKGGKIYELHVDPHSGVITKSEPKH